MNLAWIIKQKGVIHTTDLNHLIMCAHRVMLKSCSTLYLVLNGQVLHSFCIMNANDHSVALFLHNANYNNGQPAGDYRVFLQFFPHTNNYLFFFKSYIKIIYATFSLHKKICNSAYEMFLKLHLNHKLLA